MLGFHFMQARPDKQANAWIWGLATDAMTIFMIVAYILLVHFGVEVEHRLSNKSLLESRMYCGVAPRLAVPFFSVYLYGLSVGRGVFARFCKSRLLVRVLSPASYSMYLLHQPVFEWYSVVTRGSWWTQRKQFSWFSPDPMEVNFWEAFVIIALTTVFSIAVTYVVNLYLMGKWISFVRWITCRRRARHQDSAELVLAALEELAGVSVAKEDRSLGFECCCRQQPSARLTWSGQRLRKRLRAGRRNRHLWCIAHTRFCDSDERSLQGP